MNRGLFRWVGVVLLVAVSGGAWLYYGYTPGPTRLDATDFLPPPKGYSVRPTRFLVQRGEYLATGLLGCVGCHSQRDWTRFAGPLAPKGYFTGGVGWGPRPTKATARAVPAVGPVTGTPQDFVWRFTRGVRLTAEGGTAVAADCPWPAYQHLDPLDAQAVYAYVASVEVSPSSAVGKPPRPWHSRHHRRDLPPQNKPPLADTLAYGRYLVTVAACGACHANPDAADPYQPTDLRGGRRFELPTGAVVFATNLTPDPETGLGRWAEARFVQRFRHLAPPFAFGPVGTSGFSSPMYWEGYARLTPYDLQAIYRYLGAQPPVRSPTPAWQAAP